MRIKKIFQGISSHRYSREPLEKLFAEVWQEENTHNMLPYMMDSSGRSDPLPATKEQHKVAATIIQWLGSPVGQGFLAKVIEKAKNKEIPMAMLWR